MKYETPEMEILKLYYLNVICASDLEDKGEIDDNEDWDDDNSGWG